MSNFSTFPTQDHWEDEVPNYWSLPRKLYSFVITKEPETVDMDAWREHCREVWGKEKDFFLPSERKVFRSRSAAQARVDIVRRWGGDAELMECAPSWESVSDANLRRQKQRALARVRKLRVKAALIEERYA